MLWLRIEEDFAELYNELCTKSDSEKVTCVTESEENSSNDLFVPGRKDSKLSNRGRKRKAGEGEGNGEFKFYFISFTFIILNIT